MKKKADPSSQEHKPTALQHGKQNHPGHATGADVPTIVDEAALLTDLRELIQSARQRIATVANATYALLCWQVGCRLLRENLQAGRAAYGKQILATASQQLTAEFGAGFSYTALTRMARFAEWMKDERILATLSTQLSWSHFIELLPIKDPLARDFYAEMCRVERWNVRTLRRKIGGMLYERTALSKRPESVVAAGIEKLRDGQEFMKWYVAYKAETNFVDVAPQAKRLRLTLNMKFAEVHDPKGLCKDVTNVGKQGNGDVDISLKSLDELPYIMGLVGQSYERQMGDGGTA